MGAAEATPLTFPPTPSLLRIGLHCRRSSFYNSHPWRFLRETWHVFSPDRDGLFAGTFTWKDRARGTHGDIDERPNSPLYVNGDRAKDGELLLWEKKKKENRPFDLRWRHAGGMFTNKILWIGSQYNNRNVTANLPTTILFWLTKC